MRQCRLLDFNFEQIFFVEEENDAGVCEPLVVANRIEQLQTLLHAVLKIENTVQYSRNYRENIAENIE